jgi:cytochrome P450
MLGSGLFTADGPDHARRRAVAQPTFQPRNLEPLAPTMTELTLRETASWRDGDTIDLHAAAVRISLGIAGATMFGVDLDAERMRVVQEAVDALNHSYRVLVSPGGALQLRAGVHPRVRRLLRSKRDIDELVYDIIASRRSLDDSGRDDLLSLLASARDDSGEHAFSDVELRDEAVTMLMAGHETVAASIAWTFATLATRPDLQRLVHAECSATMHDATTESRLKQLITTRAIVAESLRLHPSVYSFVREPLHPVRVGPWTLQPGTDVVIPISAIHRDPRWFPAPTTFDHTRFLAGSPTHPPRHAYLPFGVGRRICIGSSFAWQQMLLVIATILHEWELTLSDGHEVRAEALFTLHPAGGLPVRLRKRAQP